VQSTPYQRRQAIVVAAGGARIHHQRLPVPFVGHRFCMFISHRARWVGRATPYFGAAWVLIAFGGALPATLAAQSRAHGCGRDQRPWVALRFEGQEWSRPLRDNVSADFRAAMRLRGIDVCATDSASATKPVAVVELRVSASKRVLVSIDIHDAITDKRVMRDVDLHAATADARGLLLAQAADELLRASWVELSVEDAPEPAAPPPPEITRAIAHPRLGQPPRTALGARAAIEHHTGGQTLLGADAFIDFWLVDRLGLSVAVGLRTGRAVDAPHGSVESRAMALSADLLTPVWPAGARYNVLVMLGVHAVNLSVSGEAVAPARSHDRGAVALAARVGVAGWWRFSDALRASLELGPGLPLRSVSAYDGDHQVMSTAGLQLHAALGLGGVF
jgi:hypothetical protein